MYNLQRMKIMKRVLYSALALLGIFAVSCKKESEAPVTPAEDTATYHKQTITATIGDDTRTAYADFQKFSWKAGDKVDILTYNESTEYGQIVTFTAQEDGATTVFEGDVEDGFNLIDLAVYPDRAGYINNDMAVYLPSAFFVDSTDEDYYTVSSENPLENLALVGHLNDEKDAYAFKTAMGALKVTFTDLSSEARFLRISAPEKISGYFYIDDNDCLSNESAVPGTFTTSDGATRSYSSNNIWYHFTPAADGTVTLYIPLPVGKLSAGTSFYVENEDEDVIFQKTAKKDIVIERNKITELTALSTKIEWVSLGTGLFGDHTQFNADYDVEVEIQRNAADPTQFRLVDPYAGYRELLEYEPTGSEYGPDPYLNFRILQKGENVNGITVTHDDLVYFDAYYTGIADDNYEVDPFLAHPARWAEEENLWLRSIVVKYQADGTPANVQLAPILFWLTDPDAGSGYWSGDNYLYKNNMIEIRFPGAERIDLQASASYIEIADSDPAQAIALVDASFSSAIASAKLVIAANADAAAAAFADAAAVTTVTASGECEVKLPANAPSGNYYVYMQTTVADGLTASANQLVVSEKFYYNNANTDLGIDVSVLYGTWTGAIIRNTSSQGYFRDTFTLAFEESDDPLTGGDVLITEIYGETATIPVYGWFDGKTGILTIAPDQPWTQFNDSYDVGMVDANNPTKDLVFRYREDGSLYLESCEFVAFYLYNTGTNVQSDYWWGYFYGDSDDYHLTMTKTTSASAPAKAKKVHANHSFSAVSQVTSTSHIPTQAFLGR